MLGGYVFICQIESDKNLVEMIDEDQKLQTILIGSIHKTLANESILNTVLENSVSVYESKIINRILREDFDFIGSSSKYINLASERDADSGQISTIGINYGRCFYLFSVTHRQTIKELQIHEGGKFYCISSD